MSGDASRDTNSEIVMMARRFGMLPTPPSGVVSRSRLRAWLFAQGGTEEDWRPFVRELVHRELWRPWHGHDVEAVERVEQTGGYRQSAAKSRDARIFPVHWPQLVLSGVTLAAGFIIYQKLETCGLMLAVPAMYIFVTRLIRGLQRERVELGAGSVRVRRGKHAREVPVSEIEWVDVITCEDPEIDPGEPNPFRRLWVDQKHMVIVRRKDGELVLLDHRLTEDAAIALCRSVESAMIESQELARANRPKVRIDDAILQAELEQIAADVDQRQRRR